MITLINLLKSYLQSTPFYQPVKKIYHQFRGVRRHPIQDFITEKDLNLIRLGTDYGGWAFIDNGDLNNCVILSAGLGEDASFEAEFASKYNAKVIVVDPTPRAILHFEGIISNLGKSKTVEYDKSGTQPIEAYDLSTIRAEQLVLIQKALWNECGTIEFFAPTNPEHVSHSIVNYQHNYRNDTSCIKVAAITVESLLSSLGIDASDISLIKLDIEGAEIEVLNQCLASGIKPRQILVEFDELYFPSDKGFNRVTDMHKSLLNNGYRLVHTDGHADFLYLKN